VTAALELVGLSRRFGRRAAVNQLSLRVEAGDCYGFLGPNGAGKTTTLRLILGLARSHGGDIAVFGDRPLMRRLRHLGAVVEMAQFHPALSGRRNLEVLAAYDQDVRAAHIDEALERVGLRDRQQDRWSTYSMGMKQRLGIAQALMRKPKLLLLDEPTNGLDPAGIKEIRNLIAGLRHDQGLTVFLSSHLLSEVQQLCNRVGILQHGRLIQEGEVHDLLASRNLAEYELTGADPQRLAEVLSDLPWCHKTGRAPDGAVRFRLSSGHHTGEVVRACQRAGLEGAAVRDGPPPDLESLFLELTGRGGQVQ
jgi:ABC-2 type transport system ATP-binding protein